MPERDVSPATEAGRALLDAPDVLLMMSGDEIIGLNEGELELHILAIEQAAAAIERRRTVERLESWDGKLDVGGERERFVAHLLDEVARSTPEADR